MSLENRNSGDRKMGFFQKLRVVVFDGFDEPDVPVGDVSALAQRLSEEKEEFKQRLASDPTGTYADLYLEAIEHDEQAARDLNREA